MIDSFKNRLSAVFVIYQASCHTLFMRKILDRLEAIHVSVLGWCAAFVSILFVRYLLEGLSTHKVSGLLGATLVHYTLFYLGVVLTLILVVNLFVRHRLRELTTLALLGLPIVWLPPVFDLLFTGGRGVELAYIFAPSVDLVARFFHFFGPFVEPGISLGMRIEIILILVAVALYVFQRRRNLGLALVAVLAAYTVLFLWLSAPSVLSSLSPAVSSDAPGGFHVVENFFSRSIASSHFMGNLVAPNTPTWPTTGLLNIQFNGVMSQVYYLVVTGLMILWGWLAYREKWKAFFRNARWLRIGHYSLLIGLGMFLAYTYTGAVPFAGWLDVVSAAVLFVSFFCAWLTAVGVNDAVDLPIDALAHPERPLVRQSLSALEMHSATWLCFVWALVGGFVAGYHAFFFVAAFSAAYYVYSAPPLRLKRVPLLATFLISLACLAAVMAGFFLVSADKSLTAFPIPVFALVIFAFTLAANIKDINDAAGDRQAGIQTLMVKYGETHGRRIIGVMTAVAIILVPLFLGTHIVWLVAIPAAIVAYARIQRRPFHEQEIFLLYFVFLIVSAILFVVMGS